MSRILLADDSPHAQRMGERILREEGYEVVTVTDGETALVRLGDFDPDLVLADVSLPGRSGYAICREVKNHPRFKHVRVILTAGLLERVDEAEAISVRCDAILKKPFEPTMMLEMVKPMLEASAAEKPDVLPPLESLIVPVRVLSTGLAAASAPAPSPAMAVDPETERIRAAVTVALDAAMPALIDEITMRVLLALRH
jgi:CheY-like chemotaxis protein